MGSGTIKIDEKVVLIVILVLLIIGLGIFFLKSSYTDSSTSNSKTIDTQFEDNDMPEKCRLPAGQDVNSWKEHLGHHVETKDCIKYFE